MSRSVGWVSDNLTAEVEDSILAGDVVDVRLGDEDVVAGLHDLVQAVDQTGGAARQATDSSSLVVGGDLQSGLVLLTVRGRELGGQVDQPD